MKSSSLQSLFRIEHPILQGPMGGGLSTPLLTASVSNLGGLGGYGAYQLEPEELRDIIQQIRTLTSKPFNINLWVNDVDENQTVSETTYQTIKTQFEPYFKTLNIEIPEWPQPQISKFEKQLEIILEEKVPVFSFVFDIPDKTILKTLKKRGIKTIGTATTVEEALVLAENPIDAIVATGFEAGGHRPSFLKPAEDSLVGTFTLVQQICQHIKHLPIIGAGGVVDKKGVDALDKLGASGVQVGTAFLATEESGASPAYRKMLFSENSINSVLTQHFTGRLARGIQGTIATELKNASATLPFPQQTLWLKTLREEAIKKNRLDLLTFWAGQNASGIKYKTVAEVMQSLIE